MIKQQLNTVNKLVRRPSIERHTMHRVCVTGGACAGKTTAIASITKELTMLNYRVLVVPEAATLLMKGGAMINSDKFTVSDGVEFQKILMKL